MKLKNILSAGLATLMLGGLASCSDDNFSDLTKGDGTVVFTTTLEDLPATRAFGDGETANNLNYAVYDTDGALVVKGTAPVSGKTATVTLQLTSGVTYDIAFFATRKYSNVYTFDANNHKVTIDYTKMAGTSTYVRYDDDCFYTVRKGYKAGSSAQENVTLRRPMSQINFGSNDLESDAVKKMYTRIYTNIQTTACNSLDLLSGEASGEEEISLPLKYINDQTTLGQFPVDGYSWLATAYILVTDPAPLRTLKMNAATYRNESDIKQTLEIPNAPTKRNYRTNIFGSLLTSTSNWKIEIEPIYEGNFNIWRGDIKDPQQDPTDPNLFTINSPAELAGLAKMVNAGNDFAGKTVKLNVDCDLNNINWTPIGTDTHPFNGVFDGNGKTISNLNITLGSAQSVPAGLFGAVKRNGSNLGSVRNLTIDGAKINTLAVLPAKHATGVAVGWVYTSGPIENVTVRNAEIDSYRWTGGVVGKGYGSVNNCTAENIDITLHFEKTAEGWDNCDKAGGIMGQQDEGGYTLTGNKATNINIVGYRHVGALFGYVNSGYDNSHKTMTGNTATGGTLTQTLAHNYKNIASGELFGEITGFLGNNVDQSGNSHSGVVINAAAIVNNAATLVTAATNGGYIVLDGNIDMSSVSGSITLTQPTNIDLNGNNLTLKSGALVNNSVLTIDGEGSIASDGFTITGQPDSKIVINGGTISSKGTASYSRTIHTAGDIEINGGTISNEKREALMLNWPNEYNKAHTAVINGGTVKTDYDYALNAYAGACKMQHKLVINGGTFIGMSGARIDGNINATIHNGIFIQTSPSSTGHALCVGAESYGSNLSKVTVNNGYFHGNAGFAICNANSATTVVNGGFLNKQGGGFTLGTGKSLVQLSSPTTLNVEGKQYSFSFQVK